MSDRDFSIGDNKFKLNKINAFRQFHITRRMGPFIADLLPVLKDLSAAQEQIESLSESEKLDEFAKLAGPLMGGLAKLTDADADYVLYGLLGSVEIQQSTGNWAFIARDNNLMMQNLDLGILIQAAGRAFMFNLSGFFDGLRRTS